MKERAEASGDREDAAYADGGMPEEEIDVVQEVEPIA